MIYIIKVNDNFLQLAPKLFDKLEGDNLIINLVQENRKLEYEFDIADEIIYDNSDYLSGTIDFEQGIIEISDHLDIIPASYKKKVEKFDFSFIEKEFDSLDYKNIFVLMDDSLDIFNLEESTIISVVSDNKSKFKNRLIITDIKSYTDNNNIIGYLNDNIEDLNELSHNIINNKIVEHKNKTFFQKIKDIFK